MEAHSETHFENEKMVLEKWKVIHPFFKFSETSIGADSISEIEMDIAQTRDRSGSVNSRDAVVASTSAGTTPTNSLDNQLYDKYQAR